MEAKLPISEYKKWLRKKMARPPLASIKSATAVSAPNQIRFTSNPVVSAGINGPLATLLELFKTVHSYGGALKKTTLCQKLSFSSE